MKARHLDSLWLLLLFGGCTFEADGANNFGSDSGTSNATSTASASETNEDGSTSSSTTTSSSTAVTDGNSGTTSSTGTADSGTASGSDSSGSTGSSCGNGVPDGDEECDDGNDDEFDECTSACTIPVCDDGEHNGSETDVDCGGTCQGCALCQSCSEVSDCDGSMVCGEAGLCVTQFDMSVDWSNNCGTSANGVTFEGLEAGTYRATASQSAGTLWLPAHNPPTTGYFYLAECTGVTFEEMRTPPGVRYINVGTAYANMQSETETFDYTGGDFTCWITDATCGDNNGGIEFSVESVCDER